MFKRRASPYSKRVTGYKRKYSGRQPIKSTTKFYPRRRSYGGGGTRLFRGRRSTRTSTRPSFKTFSRPFKRFSRKQHSRSSQTSVQKALTAFRTQQIVKYSSSTEDYFKYPYGTKGFLFMTGLSSDDCNLVQFVVQSASTVPSNVATNINDYCAVRDYVHTFFMKNISSYGIRVRVTTWVCRHDLPAVEGTVYESLLSLTTDGALTPYVNPINAGAGWPANSAGSVDSSYLMNPLWCYYFKGIKTKSYVIPPWGHATEKLHMCKKKPGWIWRYSQADSSNKTMFSKAGGFSSVVKTLEFVGELINGATVSEVNNAPVLLLTQDRISFQGASAGPQVSNFSVGDRSDETLTVGNSGDPSNIFTVGNGVSSLTSGLTSGL